MTSKNKIIVLDQREHVLLRPDLWIGSVKNKKEDFYAAEIIQEEIKIKVIENGTINPGLYRIFVEIISNVIDNYFRSEKGPTPTTSVKVDVNQETGEITVWNDGNTILIEKEEKTGLYNPEVAFGRLLSGSNFDDSEQRTTSGRNGVGAVVANIFSKVFSVKTYDPVSSNEYSQVWKNNMLEKSEPKVKMSKSANKKGFTEVSFLPDYEKFGVSCLSQDMYQLFLKTVIDMTMITSVKVLWNGLKIPAKTLKEYVHLYANQEMISIKTEDSDVVFMASNSWNQVSFVNGICTNEGGIHVDTWSDAFLRPVLEKINSVKKGTALGIKDIRPFFRIFMNCKLVNPSFTSQEKTKLSGPLVKPVVEEKHIRAILKWQVIEKIKNLVEAKDMVSLKKVEAKKTFKKIEGLDPANLAGTKHSSECSLILCEGDSARTMAVSGLVSGVYGKAGRNYIGAYSCRGKFLNPRDKPSSVIADNKEVCDIIQALNLKFNIDYTDEENFKTLNYGRVIIMADSDQDGTHITGLLINFFHAVFPSLLKRNKCFLTSMRTPIVRITYSKSVKEFYTMKDFKDYQEQNPKKGGEIKYIKGLGTNSRQDAIRIFGQKMIEFVKDEQADDNINKVFHPKQSNRRKEWLEAYQPNHSKEIVSKDQIQHLPVSDFLNNEMILFSIGDCERSLPNLMDGLKESQRKILYAVFMKNLKASGKSMKVAQLAGFVSEKTGYHHGEQCLNDTITLMTQDFVGSNNIPCLFGDGQMGSRLQMGKDAAASRYTFTKMTELTRLIFRPEDDMILQHLEDEGEKIEPTYYLPIIPMVLINGVSAIATGWSCNIPNFNPFVIIQYIKKWLTNNTLEEDSEFIPWYRKFNGTIEKAKSNQFITRGLVENKNGTVSVKELPVGMSTEKFKDFLDDLRVEKKIKNYSNHSTDELVHFEIKENEEFKCTIETLKLTSTLSINNMVLFDHQRKIHKYQSVLEIFTSFCSVRLEAYVKRKTMLLEELVMELKILENKALFLKEVIQKELDLNVDDEILYKNMKKRKFFEISSSESESIGNFGYLLQMNIRSFTSSKQESLHQEIRKVKERIDEITKISPREMWLQELEELEIGLKK